MDAPLPASAYNSCRPVAPLSGQVSIPGDKSISHRALMFSAMAVGRSRISGLLEGDDVLRTASAMRALGAVVTRNAPGSWEIFGRGVGGLVEPADVLDFGNSGTAARLICGILATHPHVAVLTGDASLRKRPMQRIIEPLSSMGCRFMSRSGGRLPMAIHGTEEGVPLHYRLPVASAQVKSAILLAGLNTPGETIVEEPLRSRDHTENLLRYFGAQVRFESQGEGRVISLVGQPEFRGTDIEVPGDFSSAAYPLVAALLVPSSRVEIRNVGLNPLRSGLLVALAEMGADIQVRNPRIAGGEDVGDLIVSSSHLRAVDVPPQRAPSMIDEYPILAVAAACAEGTTRLRGLAELRVKESDRLTATAAFLKINGVDVDITGDDLLVHGTGGQVAGGGAVTTEMDHRLAMSALVLGLASKAPIVVDDISMVDTSFPSFVRLMNELGANLNPLQPS